MSLFTELKRRNVFRVGIAYVIVAWLVLQVADVVLNNIAAPDWVFKTIMLVLVIGLPVVLVFAWAFELTPEGLKRDKDVDRSASIAPQTGRRLDRVIIGVLVMALAYFAFDKFALESRPEGMAIQQAQVQPQPNAAPAISTAAGASTSDTADARKSIVVLPFVNMSADPGQEYFSDGLSEELLNVLAKIDSLRVISRTSAFAFKGKDISIPEIAKQLDVAYVLEGSVRSAGNDMRITAQLIEVANDSHLWSEAFNRKMENIFEVQEEIAQAIARKLQVELGAGAAADRPTQNLDAYKAFLQGRHYYQARGAENLQLAIGFLNEAVQLDPAFDDAWANLAAAKAVMSFYSYSEQETLYREAGEAARTAIELNPGNGFAHAVLGLLYIGELQNERALKEFDLAIELNPNESNTYLWAGITLSELGYVDQAIGYLKRAESFDPAFANLQNWLSITHLLAGNLDQAEIHLQRSTRLDPDWGVNYPGEIELTRGDLDASETARLSALAQAADDRAVWAEVYKALRDPAYRQEAIRNVQAMDQPSFHAGVVLPLFRLGAVQDATDNWRKMRADGQRLRAANALVDFWLPYDRDKLNQPAMQQLFEDIGTADFWRQHGDPDFCRRQPDDTFRCSGL